MTTAPQKRRRYLIKKGLQLRYMSLIIVCMFVTTVVVGSLLYIEIWSAVIPEFSAARLSEKLEIASQLRAYEQVRAGREEPLALSLFREAELLSAHERATVAQVLGAANARLIPKLLLLIVVLAVASLLVSHRIAGPVYRLEKSARAVSEGDLSQRFTLRKGDELKDVAGSLETMVRFLRNKIRHALTAIKGLSLELERTSAMVGEGTEAGRLLAGLTTRTDQLERDLAVFKLD